MLTIDFPIGATIVCLVNHKGKNSTVFLPRTVTHQTDYYGRQVINNVLNAMHLFYLEERGIKVPKSIS